MKFPCVPQPSSARQDFDLGRFETCPYVWDILVSIFLSESGFTGWAGWAGFWEYL
jgi:hypothetical protein